MESLSELTALCVDLHPVGSRVTCNPPPMDTDEDYLALVDNFKAALWLSDNGFHTVEGGTYEENSDGQFVSYRKGDVNVLVTNNAGFHSAFLAASHVAKRLNLLKKTDRVALFQAVLYRNRWSEVAAT